MTDDRSPGRAGPTRSVILAKQPRLQHVYIDAFAGAGLHLSKSSGAMVPGSPLNALAVRPGFREDHLIDLDAAKVANLRSIVGERTDVYLYDGDGNDILSRQVFPRVRYKDYKRALCLLDPYGMGLEWRILTTAGRMRTIDLFLNFPIEGINRNVLWSRPEGVAEEDLRRMTLFWGDASWRDVAYALEPPPWHRLGGRGRRIWAGRTTHSGGLGNGDSGPLL